MIETATAVKADRGDALLDGALADELADEGSGLLVGAQLAGGTELGVEGRGRADGLAIDVVDDLSLNVGVGAVDGQTRTIGGAGHLAADTALAALETRLLSLKLVHAYSLDVPSPNGVMVFCYGLDYLAALPSLRRMCSPS